LFTFSRDATKKARASVANKTNNTETRAITNTNQPFFSALFLRFYSAESKFRLVREMEQQPFFRDLSGGRTSEIGIPTHDVAEASRVAAQEQMQRESALYGRPRLPKPELPPIKAPILSEDFRERIAQLDEEIYERGLTVDKELLLSLGKERFEQLLAADRKISRSTLGSNVDVTQFSSVQAALHAYEASSVPRRTTREQVAGAGKERDAVRLIKNFDDLWKFTGERREVINDIFTCRDLFENVCFAQSMLEQLSKDGKLRSRFFCGSSNKRKIELFDAWQSVLRGSLMSVKLVQPLFSLMSWLSEEKAEPPSAIDLAREFNNVRSPSKEQMQLAQALLDGFVLDYDGWALWQFVGRRTRTVQEQARLSAFRTQLARRYLRVSDFHAEMRAAFFKDVGFGAESHHEFDALRHRMFLGRTIERLADTASAVIALAIKETHSSPVARFQDSLLIEGKPPKQRAQISAQLAAAFPRSAFELEFADVQS
jgi:hypothetical protein